MSMRLKLPNGFSPFVTRQAPEREVELVPVPGEMEAFVRGEAARNGVKIVRGEPVEIRLFNDALFVVYWPISGANLYIHGPLAKT